jgi:hypothetical protein
MSSSMNSPLKAVNTADAAKRWYNDLVISRDPDHLFFMDDFDRVAFDSATDHRWTEVKDSGASVAIEADTVGGWVNLISAATTDADGASIQGNEIYKIAAGRIIHVEAKVKFHDADDCDFWFGLSENFATNPEAVFTSPDRIGFQINEGNASVLCKTELNATETSTDSGVDAADDTEMILGFKVIGVDAVEFYVNRALVATHAANIPTDELALGLAHVSGSATGTFILHCDYIMAAMSR